MRTTTVIGFAVLVVAASIGCSRNRGGPPVRWEWREGTPAEALDQARAEGRLVLALVEASWCPACRQLERDVFVHAAGRLPRGKLIGVHVDFDAPEGEAFARRHRVIGLPTTLILDADGAEKGRVDGFDDAASYVDAVRRAVAGVDDLAEVLRKIEAKPDDPKLLAQAGTMRLCRGDKAEGFRLLERARSLDAGNRNGAWAEATRALGRYQLRVVGDAERALAYFREGADVAGDTEAGWGFRYWVAMSLEKAGRREEAIRFLDGLVAAAHAAAEPLALKARFLHMNRLDDEEAFALARRAAEIDPTGHDRHYLLGVTAERLGRADVAARAARRALELSPGKAIYEELLARTAGAGPDAGEAAP